MGECLWLLTARGGSKGVPGKNLKRIGGLSLIGWKAHAARAAGAIRIVCSTDSTDIAVEARAQGCDVPFMRPAALASDTASSASVVRHTLDTLKAMEGSTFEHVMLLEPSAPFTGCAYYGIAMGQMSLRKADLVVGMKAVEPHSTFTGEIPDDMSIEPIVVKMRARGGKTRRQDFPREWTQSGSLYMFRVDTFMRTGDIYGGEKNYGVLIDKWRAIEIDTPTDMEMAVYAYNNGHVQGPPGFELRKGVEEGEV